jgi:hypothetical protein
MLVQAHVDFSRTFLTTFFLFHTSRLPVLSIGYPCIAMSVSFVFCSCSSLTIRLEYLPLFTLVGLVYLMSFGTRHFILECLFVAYTCSFISNLFLVSATLMMHA